MTQEILLFQVQKKEVSFVPLISPLCYLMLSKEQKADKVHFKKQLHFADESHLCCRYGFLGYRYGSGLSYPY